MNNLFLNGMGRFDLESITINSPKTASLHLPAEGWFSPLFFYIDSLSHPYIYSSSSQSACVLSTRASDVRKQTRKIHCPDPNERNYAQEVTSCCYGCPKEPKIPPKDVLCQYFIPLTWMDNLRHKGSCIGGHSPPHMLKNIQLHGGRDAIGNYLHLVSIHCSLQLLLHLLPPSALHCTHVCRHWLETEGWFRAGLAGRWARKTSQSLGQTFSANRGLAKSIWFFLLVVSKHRSDAGLILSSDRDEGRKPNVAHQPSQFCSPNLSSPSHSKLSTGCGSDRQDRAEQWWSPITFHGANFQPELSKQESHRSPVGLFHPPCPADSVLQESSCTVETFPHQPLW